MVNFIKRYVTLIAVALALVTPALVPVGVSAQDSPDIQGPLCSGANLEFNPDSDACTGVETADTQVTNIIKTVINVISVIVGVVAVIMIVFGGLKYITSGGDSGNVSAAKNTIIFAIVGLVIVALAQLIVRFVLDQSINAGE